MRYLQLDFIRGTAIILMMLFHLCFDLNNFNFIDVDIYHAREWFYFRMLILTLFILCVGISLSIANENGVDFKKNLKRFLFLLSISGLVSLASYFTFPKTWIYFGVLHFIAFGSITALLFIKLEWFSLILGVSIVGLFNLDLISTRWAYDFLKPLLNLPKYTEDLVSFTPWFGVLLIGSFIGGKRLFLFPIVSNASTEFVGFLGRHSLIIYLLHQAVFFGLIALADYLLH